MIEIIQKEIIAKASYQEIEEQKQVGSWSHDQHAPKS